MQAQTGRKMSHRLAVISSRQSAFAYPIVTAGSRSRDHPVGQRNAGTISRNDGVECIEKVAADLPRQICSRELIRAAALVADACRIKEGHRARAAGTQVKVKILARP